MKSLYVFTYDRYHAQGGFQDFVGRFEREEEIKDFLRSAVSKEDSLAERWQDIQLIKITENLINIIAPGVISVAQYI